MNMAHASERYGYLCSNGLPIPDESISRYCGCTLPAYQSLLAELERANVPRRTPDGIIYSKRMVDDDRKRRKWQQEKKNQRLTKSPRNVRSMSVDCPSPFLSPSPPPLKETERETLARSLFEKFWEAYPRKLDRDLCWQLWLGLSPIDWDCSVESVVLWAKSEEWSDQQFVPAPETFLRKRRWESKPVQKQTKETLSVKARELEKRLSK